MFKVVLGLQIMVRLIGHNTSVFTFITFTLQKKKRYYKTGLNIDKYKI